MLKNATVLKIQQCSKMQQFANNSLQPKQLCALGWAAMSAKQQRRHPSIFLLLLCTFFRLRCLHNNENSIHLSAAVVHLLSRMRSVSMTFPKRSLCCLAATKRRRCFNNSYTPTPDCDVCRVPTKPSYPTVVLPDKTNLPTPNCSVCRVPRRLLCCSAALYF